MALQIRRGTDAQRLTITPAEGELIYTTDTKLLYVGDGSTAGGTKADTGINDLLEDTTPQLGGNLDLNSQDITGVGNINNSGNITASGVVSAASGNFTNGTFGLATGNFKGTFAADDSVILIDGVSGKVNLAPNAINDIGNVAAPNPSNGDVLVYNTSSGNWESGTANVTGNLVGSVFADDSKLMIDGISGIAYGPFIGDLNGSVFGDQSTQIVDGQSGNILPAAIIAVGNTLDINPQNTGTNEIILNSTDELGILRFKRTQAGDLEGNTTIRYGSIFFERNDDNGTRIVNQITGKEDALYFINNPDGDFEALREETYLAWIGNKLGVGTYAPREHLDVRGSAIIESDLKAAAITGDLKADDSTVIVDATTQGGSFTTLASSTSLQLATYADATARDAGITSPANGMLCYLTGTHKFQGYANGAWVDLN